MPDAPRVPQTHRPWRVPLPKSTKVHGIRFESRNPSQWTGKKKDYATRVAAKLGVAMPATPLIRRDILLSHQSKAEQSVIPSHSAVCLRIR